MSRLELVNHRELRGPQALSRMAMPTEEANKFLRKGLDSWKKSCLSRELEEVSALERGEVVVLSDEVVTLCLCYGGMDFAPFPVGHALRASANSPDEPCWALLKAILEDGRSVFFQLTSKGEYLEALKDPRNFTMARFGVLVKEAVLHDLPDRFGRNAEEKEWKEPSRWHLPDVDARSLRNILRHDEVIMVLAPCWVGNDTYVAMKISQFENSALLVKGTRVNSIALSLQAEYDACFGRVARRRELSGMRNGRDDLLRFVECKPDGTGRHSSVRLQEELSGLYDALKTWCLNQGKGGDSVFSELHKTYLALLESHSPDGGAKLMEGLDQGDAEVTLRLRSRSMLTVFVHEVQEYDFAEQLLSAVPVTLDLLQRLLARGDLLFQEDLGIAILNAFRVLVSVTDPEQDDAVRTLKPIIEKMRDILDFNPRRRALAFKPVIEKVFFDLKDDQAAKGIAELVGQASGRIVFSPAAELLDLPWDVLPCLNDRDFTVCPSLWLVGAALRDDLALPQCSAPVFVAEKTFVPLDPGMSFEMQCIPFLYNSQVQRLTSSETLALPSPRLFHFIGHGDFDPTCPEDSYLLYYDRESPVSPAHPDASILVEDVFRSVRWPGCGLVLLPNCESGMCCGTSFSTFPVGFLCAGASAVLGGLWPVDDVASCILMSRLHWEMLFNGVSPSLALGRARTWLSRARVSEISTFLNLLIDRVLEQFPDKEDDLLRALDRMNLPVAQDMIPFNHVYFYGCFRMFGVLGRGGS